MISTVNRFVGFPDGIKRVSPNLNRVRSLFESGFWFCSSGPVWHCSEVLSWYIFDFGILCLCEGKHLFWFLVLVFGFGFWFWFLVLVRVCQTDFHFLVLFEWASLAL